MSAELINALQRKCESDDRLRLLQAQWEYDQRLIAQALQAIGITFPHYSLHDASHSNTILVQITRVLGAERIEQLSATDIWMLLEAAYLHDIGMVVDDETLRRWWRKEPFRRHVEALRIGNDRLLRNAAQLLDKEKACMLESKTWPLDIKRAVTLVVADYARTQHAQRSSTLVNDPMRIGLESPRTHLIPDRLIRCLANIVRAHALSQQEVLELPRQESGLGTDVCHPRFVAFMLRLGDLLDLDNGRFCPVLASTFGALPRSSLSHVGKHASIRHFHVSPARVEVEAVCTAGGPDNGSNTSGDGGKPLDADSNDPYGAYEAVASWLDWLSQEVQFLASRWADIAPQDFGGAPSLGVIKATLEGYRFLEEGKRPQFRVDEPAFLNLVRGNNLYKERYDWLRELVANAEDATRIRVFVEAGDAIKPLPLDKPIADPFEELRELLAAYPVRIRIEKVEGSDSRWEVEVEDEGTGISINDLRYILTIGSSKKNPERLRLIRQMPPHLEPTGSFGIGLQSVFMVTDKLTIESMHFRTGDRIHVLVRRPPMEDQPLDINMDDEPPAGVYVRDLKEDELPIKPGTRISFQFEVRSTEEVTEGEPTQDETNDLNTDDETSSPEPDRPSDSSPEAEGYAFSFDPILAESGELEIEQLRAAAYDLAENMLVPIILDGQPLETKVAPPADEVRLHDPKLHCTIKYTSTNSKDNPITLNYRGARVSDHRLEPLGLLDITFVIEFGRASDLLTASRSMPTAEGHRIVREKVWEALASTFPHYLEQLKPNTDPNQRQSCPRASLFAKLYLSGQAVDPGDDWRQVPLLKKENDTAELTAGKIYDDRQLGLAIYGTFGQSIDGARQGATNWYEIRSADFDQDNWPRWLRDALLHLSPFAEYQGTTGNQRCYVFHKADQHRSATENAMRQYVQHHLRDVLSFRPFRPVFPSPDHIDYSRLSFDVRELPSWKSRHDWIVSKVLVSPLEFACVGNVIGATIRHLPQYIDWVAKRRRITSDDERREICVQTQRFIQRIAELLAAQGLRLFDQQLNLDSDLFTPEASARELAVPVAP